MGRVLSIFGVAPTGAQYQDKIITVIASWQFETL